MAAWFTRLSWSQRVGSAFGAVYVLIGVVGFAVTTGVGFAALRGKDLVLFELNPLHNVVHLGIGAALLYAAINSASASRLMNRLIGGTYLAVAVAGAFIVEADTSLFGGLSEQRSELNILALNHPDNFLHIASAIVLIASTIVGRRRPNDAVLASTTGGALESTGEMDAFEGEQVVVEKSSVAAASARSRRGHLEAGDIVPKAGNYRCACAQFAVAIRQGRQFPECPEPSGTDDDHYFTLQTKPSASVAKRNGGPKATGKKPTPRVKTAKTSKTAPRR